MPTRLHQILALEKTAKATTEGAVTRAYHDAQKTALFNGLTRVYTASDADDQERLPPERKMVQLTAAEVLGRAAQAWTRQANVVATKDATNQTAKASVMLGGQVLVVDVPVSTLLYLEKMLVNVAEMVKKLPVLDPEVEWGTAPDSATGQWRSKPEQTVRTKKVPKSFVKAWPTKEHPNIVPQVETYTEDKIVGTWQKTLLSGALPAARKADMLSRVQELQEAVKVAREYANQAVVVPGAVGEPIFDFVLGALG
jgi:hypothetical protein